MNRIKAVIFILFTAVFFTAIAHCQESLNGLQLKAIAGKVTKVDLEGGVISVLSNEGIALFYLSVESDLYRSTHHIASLEIELGDPVVIQYVRSSGKNNVIKLVDNKVVSS